MSDISANNKRIAKNSVFMSVRMVIVLLINLYTSRVLLKTLGVEDYGVYNVVAGFVTMFTFLNTSLSNGIQRFYNFHLGKERIEEVNMVFQSAMTIQITLALMIVLPTEIFGMWYLENKMVIPEGRMFAAQWTFHLAMITFVVHILQVPFSAAVMAHEKMDFFAFASVLYAVLTLFGVLFLSHVQGDSLILYGVIILFAACCQIIAFVTYCKKHFEEIYWKSRLDKGLIKEMMSFSGWNVTGTLGGMLKDQGTNIVLNLFLGPVVNAARAIAYQVNAGLQSFVSNIAIPVRPQMVKAYAKGDYQRAYNLTYTISKLSCYVLLLMALPVTLEIDYVLKIWLGDNIPSHTSAFVVLVILDTFLANLNGAISGIVHASGKMRLYQLSGAILNILILASVYITMLVYKIPEYAFGVIILGDIIRQVMAITILKKIDNNRLSQKEYYVSVIMPIIVVSISAIILPYVVRSNMETGIVRFIIVTVLSFASVCSTIYLFGLSFTEKQFVSQIVNKFLLTRLKKQ